MIKDSNLKFFILIVAAVSKEGNQAPQPMVKKFKKNNTTMLNATTEYFARVNGPRRKRNEELSRGRKASFSSTGSNGLKVFNKSRMSNGSSKGGGSSHRETFTK